VAVQHALQRAANSPHLGVVEGRLGVARRVPGGQQEGVAVPEGDLEALRQHEQ
jgi:hypothetical protein